MTKYEMVIDALKDKIPAITRLANYHMFISVLGISNRAGVHSIFCNMKTSKFKEFCQEYSIDFPDNFLGNNLYTGFDVDSLFSESYRLYVTRKSISLASKWKNSESYPLQYIDISHFDGQIEYINSLLHERGLYARSLENIKIVSTEYPIIVAQDFMGSFTPIDGMHRLKKLKELGETQVLARVVPLDSVAALSSINLALTTTDLFNVHFKDFYSMIKNHLLEEIKKTSNTMSIENIDMIGFYFNKFDQKIEIFKFYFHNSETNQNIQYKYNASGDYLGSFIEEKSYDLTNFNDTLGIVDSLSQFNPYCIKRIDADQSHLGVI